MCQANPVVQRGFTLIEILVVVIILGIAGAIIVPQLGSRDDLKASASARVVVADLIYAQNMAITKQTPHYVVFAGQQYTLVSSPGGPAIMHPVNKSDYVVRLGPGGSPGMRDTQLIQAGFIGQTSATTYSTIGFDELGTPLVYTGTEPAETLTSGSILLKSGTQQVRINVVPFTGELEVVRN